MSHSLAVRSWGPVPAAGEDRLAIGAIAQASDPIGMFQRRADRFAGSRLPLLDRAIPTARQHGPAIGAEGQGPDRGLMAEWFAARRGCQDIPQLGCVIETTGQYRLAVGTERDRLHGPAMRQRRAL